MVQWDGVMLIRKNIAPEIEILKTDPKRKYMILNINSNVTIGATYAPSGILKEKQQERKKHFSIE